MNRNKFLSMFGLIFSGTFLFSAKRNQDLIQKTECGDPVTPAVPEGPFYKNEHLNRIDITEGRKGVVVDYAFKVEDKNCKPVKNAVVDIWQCDADGHYSDFQQENTLNQTWLRGYQKTGSDGYCKFKSIFPGWYPGRITHVHVKVRIGDKDILTTNLFFQKDFENEIYKSPFYSKGANPTQLSDDIELHGDTNTTRHDTLVIKAVKNNKGTINASYTFAIG